MVVGDRRPYLVALVTLDPEEAVAYAKEHGLPEDPEQLAANADVKKAIEAHVEKINEKFARVEQVKKIAILPQDLSQESGELTPTLKVKRAVVTAQARAGDRGALRGLRWLREGSGTGPAEPARVARSQVPPDRHPTPLPAALAGRVELLDRLVEPDSRRRGAARRTPDKLSLARGARERRALTPSPGMSRSGGNAIRLLRGDSRAPASGAKREARAPSIHGEGVNALPRHRSG